MRGLGEHRGERKVALSDLDLSLALSHSPTLSRLEERRVALVSARVRRAPA